MNNITTKKHTKGMGPISRKKANENKTLQFLMMSELDMDALHVPFTIHLNTYSL